MNASRFNRCWGREGKHAPLQYTVRVAHNVLYLGEGVSSFLRNDLRITQRRRDDRPDAVVKLRYQRPTARLIVGQFPLPLLLCLVPLRSLRRGRNTQRLPHVS